jgi:4-hydroxybenzoate polyprenyltransferase
MEHSLKPYIELMRLDKPIGIYLLAWPCLWSIAFADPSGDYLWLYFVFAVGSIIMRSAECVMNDIADRKIDAKVKRTKSRPLASGKITLSAAFLTLFCLLTLGLFLLVTLSYTAIMLGVFALIPMAIYPFMKRFTYWPQAFLGITINWGALMGWAAVHDNVGIPSVLLYLAAIFWTIGYDTIYGHQDKLDDLELGVKSTALKFGEKTKSYLVVFYGLTIVLLWFVGALLKVNFWYHVFLLLGILHLVWQVLYLDINKPDNCLRVFKSNAYFGAVIFIGALLGSTSF